MPRTLGRNLQMCFPKIMYPPTSQKSIEKLQTQDQKDNQNPNTTLSSILIKNFNSLYQSSSSSFKLSPSSPHSDDTDTTTPDFATVYASQRFFFSSPGHSNSITESATSSLSSSSCSSSSLPVNVVVEGGVPIPTLSPDPYVDFRRSMQEMVEARDLVDVRANWEHLHEILTCYLSLNPKSTHKFIVGAFADLLVSLLKSSPVQGSRRNGDGDCIKSGETCNNDMCIC